MNVERMQSIDKNDNGLESIACKLLNDKFLLTALELHLELLEMGQELTILRDFFSNPANFEQSKIENFQSKLIRTSSIQTFDSLDFARYSDDGDKFDNDKVAVLEFELRKAHEQILVLRSILTKSAENSSSSKIISKDFNSELESYEQRTLNFLINEYLLKYNYKLTSVTFSEENNNQDFEDWDDVGVNVSKPPSLIHLYRNYRQHAHEVGKQDFQCMTSVQQPDDSSLAKDKIIEWHVNNSKSLKRRIDSLENLKDILEKENSTIKDDLKYMPNKFSYNKSFPVSINSYQTNNTDENVRNFCDPQPQVYMDLKSDYFNAIEKDEFQMSLIKLIDESKHVFNFIMDVKSIKLNQIVNLLADSLPNMISNTLLAKREELIPMLIYTTALHSDLNVRDKLLNLFFNLIKKPTSNQRLLIINGCLTYSKHIGLVQTEAELLPYCWTQMTHKHIENRILVAEICGYLGPYVCSDTRSSLLFSMINQISEDKEEDVREAAVQSLALIVSNFENDTKYSQTIEMLSNFLRDRSEKVDRVARILLLPSVARWSLLINCFEMFLKTIILEKIYNCIYTTSITSKVVKDQKLFTFCISNMKQILPNLLCYFVQTCQKFLVEKQIIPDLAPNDQLKNSLVQYIDAMSTILNKPKEEITLMVDTFINYINQESFEIWDACKGLVDEFLTPLIDLLSKLEISQPALHSIVTVFQELYQMFGHNFSSFVFGNIFEKFIIFPIDEFHLDEMLVNSQSALNKSIVPVYLAGFNQTSTSLAESTDLKNEYLNLYKMLSNLLISLSIHQSSLLSLQSTFEELCFQESSLKLTETRDCHNIIIKLLWEEGVMHKNPLVRISTAKVFECVIASCSITETLLTNKVLPALITLASDVNESVKVATIPSFGAIIEYVFLHLDNKTSSILEKVKLQLQIFMSEQSHISGNNNELHPELVMSNKFGRSLIVLEVIKVLGKLGPKVESNFRDEFILPRLTALAVRSQLSQNMDPTFKHELTMKLLEAFINISCCFICQQVSQEIVLPGLRCLHHDIQAHAPDRANIVVSIIKELEDKSIDNSQQLQNQNAPRIQTHTEPVKNNFLNRFKDIREKTPHSNLTKLFQNTKN